MIFQPLTSMMLLLLVAFFTILPTIGSVCSDMMASSLSSRGFTLFAHALHAHPLTSTSTTRLTFLAPPDTTLLNHHLNNEILNAHIATAGAYPYQSLLSLPPNTTFPTLHQNTSLVVGTDGQHVSFNNILVAVPNLYIDGSCIVHGVDGPLAPIPSPVDDSFKSRNLGSPSTLRARRRKASQIGNYVRFIRRANHPDHDEKAFKYGHHP